MAAPARWRSAAEPALHWGEGYWWGVQPSGRLGLPLLGRGLRQALLAARWVGPWSPHPHPKEPEATVNLLGTWASWAQGLLALELPTG